MKALTLTILFFAIAATSFATQDKKTLNLRIQGVDGYLDETAVYFDLGVTPAYFYAQDAAKVYSTIAAMPAIYTISSDNVNCSNSGYSDLSETAVIDLGVVVPTSGTFKITMRSFNNFNPTTIITLEDRLLNVSTDLRTNFYSIQINTEDTIRGRFFLHVSKAVQFNAITAGCTNLDGMVSVIADSTIQWDLCQLFDSNGAAAGNYSNISGAFNFTDLSAGDYSIRFTYGTYTTTQQIHLNGNYVKASIGSSINNVLVGEEINFTSTSTNATGFAWEFGDGTIITGVSNPSMLYYTAGDYTVNLTCSNAAGCSETAQLAMKVTVTTAINDQDNKGIAIIAQSKTVTVNMNDVSFNNFEIQVVNLVGQPVYSNTINDQTTVLALNEIPTGYYVVAVKNAGKVTTQKIYIN